jgi:hypothetical protein
MLLGYYPLMSNADSTTSLRSAVEGQRKGWKDFSFERVAKLNLPRRRGSSYLQVDGDFAFTGPLSPNGGTFARYRFGDDEPLLFSYYEHDTSHQGKLTSFMASNGLLVFMEMSPNGT